MIKNNFGFTLIEVLMSVALISVFATTLIYTIDNNVDEARFQETINEMNEIKKALVGDSEAYENAIRKDFGYIGGVGSLPTALQTLSALTTKPAAVAAWSINSSVRFGIGWNGAYLQDGDSSIDYTKDAWGNDYVYSPATNPPTITSLGADGVVGGTVYDQDIKISFPDSVRVATVSGFVSNGNVPYAAAMEVEINYPDGSGALVQTIDSVTALEEGAFQFSSIPFGVRSVTVYIPTKAAPSTTIGPILFSVDKSNFVLNL